MMGTLGQPEKFSSFCRSRLVSVVTVWANLAQLWKERHARAKGIAHGLQNLPTVPKYKLEGQHL